MQLWAMAQIDYIENQNLNNLAFEVIQKSGTNPIIQVDEKNKIIEVRNIQWNSNLKDSTYLYKKLEQIKKENDPILIQYRNKEGLLIVDHKLYYGDSLTLKKLQYYPLALLLIILLFMLVLYFVFKTSKISEQNRLWAGMARETAHQIGTPLTSMMGWITLLKEKKKKSESIIEIEKDIERLKIISERFSKIGSIPELKKDSINNCISKTVIYLKKRSSEHINFKIKIPEKDLIIPFNYQLLSWTIENLIKNSIDAIKGRGLISIELIEKINTIEINIEDNGVGIKHEDINKIFTPGFTSKKRGWGLGLSLAKRIIVDFHKGKINVKNTKIGKGSLFQILLNK
ncbi:MAG: two-component sensor histidine kinase [Flavobacteriaceae bacterium]|nr:two-component sensor histidine kinase [Flavobacteriaceae bacterium]